MDKQLQTVLNGGTINTIFLGGTGTEHRVATHGDLDTTKADITANTTNITANANSVVGIDTRVAEIETHFNANGMEFDAQNPAFKMGILAGGLTAQMQVVDKETSHAVATMEYLKPAQSFMFTLFDKDTGATNTDFVLLADGTCQIGGKNVATEEFVTKKDFYRYYKMQQAFTVNTDTWTEVARLQENSVPAGIEEYGLAMTFTYSSTSRSAMFRFSTDGGTNWSYWNKEVKDISNDELFYYAYPSENSNDEDVTLIVEAKCESASDNLIVKFLNLTIERKADY